MGRIRGKRKITITLPPNEVEQTPPDFVCVHCDKTYDWYTGMPMGTGRICHWCHNLTPRRGSYLTFPWTRIAYADATALDSSILAVKLLEKEIAYTRSERRGFRHERAVQPDHVHRRPYQ